jgi:predicted nuclease of predicted toxin-antitoxin system
MLRLLTDEHILGDIIRGIRRREPGLDIVRVQEVGLMATDDRIILDWAATEERILVSEDRQTLIGFAYERVKAGLPMPGVFIHRKGLSIGDAIDAILVMSMCSSPDECKDQVRHVPL